MNKNISFAKEFVSGFFLPFKSFRFLREHKRLLPWAMLPLLLNIVIYGFIISLFFYLIWNWTPPQAEWEFWGSNKAIAAMPEGRENFAVGAKSRFEKIKEQITLFNAGQEVTAGIEAVDTGGHTPGHTSFVLHSGAESIMILGDALTHPIVSFEYPKWLSDSDMDQQKAADVRLALLDRLVSDKIKIAATHLPAPGFGHVEKYQSAWRYIASETA